MGCHFTLKKKREKSKTGKLRAQGQSKAEFMIRQIKHCTFKSLFFQDKKLEDYVAKYRQVTDHQRDCYQNT